MLTRIVARTSAGLALAAGLVVLGATAASACGQGGGCHDGGGANETGHTIQVRVSGSYVSGGSPGHPGTTTVSTPVPCWYTQGYTGKEYAEWVDSGQAQVDWHHTGGDVDGPYEPYPDYEAHADDDKGHWYGAACSSETFDNFEDFDAYTDQWFATHPSIYVEWNEQPPTPPLPPEVLLYAATEALEVPEPTFDWNPHVQGAASVVNLPTWFWSTAGDIEGGNVVASAGGHSAEVRVDLSGVTYSSVHAGSVPCPDGGTPWTPGAVSSCTLSFPQATGAETVTATANWTAGWSYDGAYQGEVEVDPTSVTHGFPVLEVQTTVTGVG